MLGWKMVPREPLPGTAMVRAGKEGTRPGLTQHRAVLCRGKHQPSKSWASSLQQESCETRGGQARLCRTQAAWGCVSAHSERELRKETSKPDLPVLAKKKNPTHAEGKQMPSPVETQLLSSPSHRQWGMAWGCPARLLVLRRTALVPTWRCTVAQGTPAVTGHPRFGPLPGFAGNNTPSFLTSHPQALTTFPLCRPMSSRTSTSTTLRILGA